jgi:hypothetical protein
VAEDAGPVKETAGDLSSARGDKFEDRSLGCATLGQILVLKCQWKIASKCACAKQNGMQLKDVPMAGGGITRTAYAFACQAHLSVGPLLTRANLSVQQIKNPRVRIPVKDQIKFLNLLADKLQDEFLGIRLAQTRSSRVGTAVLCDGVIRYSWRRAGPGRAIQHDSK